jgi:hypothetical protein
MKYRSALQRRLLRRAWLPTVLPSTGRESMKVFLSCSIVAGVPDMSAAYARVENEGIAEGLKQRLTHGGVLDH